MIDVLDEDLLEFAVGLYSVDAVKQQCLGLQESQSVSVNLVLWLCWLDARKICIDKSALATAQDIVGGANLELLTALRDARTRLLQETTFTRVQGKLISKQICAAEVAIEKILLQRLQDLTSRLDRIEPNDEVLNLFDYLDSVSPVESGTVSAELLDHSRNYVVVQRELA